MTERKTSPLLLSSIIVVLVAAIGYVVLEFVARSVRIVDEDIAEKIAAAADPRRDLPGLAAYTRLDYGWDWPPILLPPEGEGVGSTADVLMLGDSVTRGFGVEEDEGRPYPALLQDLLSGNKPVRIVNSAVPGFGLDQIVLKLEAELEHMSPRLVVVSYIPHDLHRTARDFSFGITKPVLWSYAGGAWKMRSAVDLFAFYQEYLKARSTFSLAPFWLAQFARNREYYLSGIYKDEYQIRFEGLRRHLEDLAAAHGVRLILVRLANGELGNSIARLDDWGMEIFAAADPDRLRFFDVEPCTREYASRESLDWHRVFRRHPGARAHEIFALCLLPHIATELGSGS